MSTADTPREDHPEELVILIHGTFAGSESNVGDKWWQSGSKEVVELQQRLPENIRIASGDEVFHWSGENGERARSKAATELLEHLGPLEESGHPYHLVGHSHGGSVIWNALKLRTLAGKPLQGLKSWTTVGTPFLHHTTPKPWHYRNLIALIIGIAFMRPAFNTACSLGRLMWNAVCGREFEFIAKPASEVGYMAVLRAPFLALGEWMGLALERTDEGIQIGSYDPASGQTVLEYLFTTREGLILIGLMVALIYIFFHIATLCLRPVIASWRSYAESRLLQRAYDRYGEKWLGLWSEDDEAINGLRATLNLSLSFVKRMAPSDRVFLTDNLSLVSRPYFWVFAPVFNTFLRPVIDSFVSGVLIRSVQGNDRPSAQVVAVLAVPCEQFQVGPLPDFLQQKILKQADRHAGNVAPRLRQLIASPSFTSGLEEFNAQLSGEELVHTSYFDHSEVLDLITCNIRSPSMNEAKSSLLALADYPLIEWFREFKRRAATENSKKAAAGEPTCDDGKRQAA